MALRFRAAMHGVMLWRRDDFVISRIVALQPFDELHAQTRRQVRVFAVSLLAASPARVAEDVDIRAPHRQALVAAIITLTHGFVMLGARFGRDTIGDAKR